MDLFYKGWFTELDPFESARIINDKEQTSENVTVMNNGDGGHVAADGRRVRPESATYEQVQMGEAWPGQATSLRVDQVLFDEKSEYQHVMICKTHNYGKMLVLDNVIQCTERDEFMYQEMLAHLPLCLHPNPKRVLIIGGGDGGCVRETLRHSCVESVVLCEIDKMVVDACKAHIPTMASCLSDARVTVYHGDGFAYLKEQSNEFDVIITDSSDPIGPAESLFNANYYQLVHNALTEHGVMASQGEPMHTPNTHTVTGESAFLHMQLVKRLLEYARAAFPSTGYANGLVPTYPCGHIGYLVCSKDANCDVRQPKRPISEVDADKMGLRYYNEHVHRAAFAQPQFVSRVGVPPLRSIRSMSPEYSNSLNRDICAHTRNSLAQLYV